MSADASPESFSLAFIAGPRTGDTIEILPGNEYVLGCGSDADILVDHKKASRRHARIFHQAEALFIEDLGSINGTFEFGEEDPIEIEIENKIDLSLEALLQGIESFSKEYERLDKLMPAPDALIQSAASATDANLSDDGNAIIKLIVEDQSVSKVMDRFPGTDTQAVKTIADLVERGVLSFQR